MANRLDLEMVRRGIVPTRNKAADLIKGSRVFVNGIPAKKAGMNVRGGDEITTTGRTDLVGRGARKLAAAVDLWNPDIKGLRCLDIGSSTGGFTQILLEHGARHVSCVDTGTDQLAPEIKGDPRVSAYEGQDIRNFKSEEFDLAVCDVSFISIKHILPSVFRLLKPGALFIALVKPQFEMGRKKHGGNGVVRDEKLRLKALEGVCRSAEDQGFSILDRSPCPVAGTSGNIEYLVYMRRKDAAEDF